MAIEVLDVETMNRLPQLADVNTVYGVNVNALNVDELFALYERAGFLYPAKAARLLPHMDLVRDNWRRLLEAGESLLYVLTAGEAPHGMTSIAVWRTTSHGWTWQHLVSEHNPMGSRSTMLAGLARCMQRPEDESHQNWFRPENRFPARVFGSMVQTVGDELSSVRRHMYFALPRDAKLPYFEDIRVVPYSNNYHEPLCALARLVRGNIYVHSEELETDVELKAVDEMYRGVGLRRTRQVWLAYWDRRDQPVGAVLCYRGPVGLNFSYIENRCELLINPALSEADVLAVTASLMRAARTAYTDFELNDIPIVADDIAATALTGFGAEFLRRYCQGIWLREGQPRLYRHVERFYSRLVVRAEKYNPQPSLTV